MVDEGDVLVSLMFGALIGVGLMAIAVSLGTHHVRAKFDRLDYLLQGVLYELQALRHNQETQARQPPSE